MSNSVSDDRNAVSLQEAAEALGVHYMTAYRYVRLGLLEAKKVGGSWSVSHEAMRSFRRPGSSSSDAAPSSTSPPNTASARDNLSVALLNGDEEEAWAILDHAAEESSTLADIHCDLIGPVMQHIGESWESGRLSIADEHRATAILSRLVPQLGARFTRPGRRTGTVIVGGLQADQHALPTTLFADLLRTQGVNVIDLGGTPPTEAFLDALESVSGQAVVCITVMTSGHDDALLALLDAVRTAAPAAAIAVGGAAIQSQQDADRVGSAFWSADPRDAAVAIATEARQLASSRLSA